MINRVKFVEISASGLEDCVKKLLTYVGRTDEQWWLMDITRSQ